MRMLDLALMVLGFVKLIWLFEITQVAPLTADIPSDAFAALEQFPINWKSAEFIPSRWVPV